MFAGFAKGSGKQVRCAIGDQMLLGEVGRGSDEDRDLDEAPDLFERSKGRLGLRQDVDGAIFRGFLSGGRVEVTAEKAGESELAILERQLAGGEKRDCRFWHMVRSSPPVWRPPARPRRVPQAAFRLCRSWSFLSFTEMDRVRG